MRENENKITRTCARARAFTAKWFDIQKSAHTVMDSCSLIEYATVRSSEMDVKDCIIEFEMS